MNQFLEDGFDFSRKSRGFLGRENVLNKGMEEKNMTTLRDTSGI